MSTHDHTNHRSHRRRGAWFALAMPLLALALAGCTAMRLHDEGLRLIETGQGRQGLALLRQGSELEPTNARLRVAYLRELNQWLASQAARAEALRSKGEHDAALAVYRDMLDWQPSHAGAQRGVLAVEAHRRRGEQWQAAEEALARRDHAAARRLAQDLTRTDPADLRAAQLLQRVGDEEARHAREAEARRKTDSPMAKPVSLQFREAGLKMVFEALSRSTGINIVFDKDVRADLRTTIFVTNVPLEEAIDLVLVQNQLARRMLTPSSVLVYPATAQKQREYQELHVRTFLLSNADAKHVQNVLKTLLKVRDVVVDERANAIVLRESLETLDVAQKIIASQESVEPEVMLEVEVLEVSRDRLTALGLRWPDSVSLSTPSSTGATLGALRALGRDDLVLSPGLSLALNLKLQDTDANLLASPRLRARSREKAKVLIGDKVPVIVNTVTPVQSGAPVVTGSVQYIDVGLKLEVEPQVYAEGEVSIRVNLEVSNIVREIAGPQGSLAYQIGTRNAQTVLRLRDGETQVLAGLISDSERNTGNRVPGVGQLPVLSKLFGSDSGNRSKTEIVLSITPRIVRHRPVDVAHGDVASGTEASVRGGVSTAPVSSPEGRPAPAPMPSLAAPRPAGAAQGPASTLTPSLVINPGADAAAASSPPASQAPSAAPAAPAAPPVRPGFAPPVQPPAAGGS
ncbi:secretin N-terminal domain-containing protein [Ideonella sp. A 288]|uniref:secretin N-terminal domain-containing protein n=1 Tax=Ideonella sp. A 288 TaxID=1962181 RepID=UPI000B4C106C|nr:secretin N-terminal domain-containing protein [Ideonella sp. A 288]